MPDITMCKGDDCPLKESCWRYTATPTPAWQSYFMSIPYDKKKKKCKQYWENSYGKNKRKEEV